MRRSIAIAAAMALIVAACGDSGDTAEGPTATESGTQEPSITDPDTAQGSVADLAITEVVFGDHVTITNLGSSAVSVEGLWLCNRPSYTELPTAVVAAGESIDIPADALGGLPASGAEAALYSSNSFGDSGAMLDYVAWGGGGGRSEVASGAGLWPSGDLVSPGGDMISAPAGGAAASDWSS